MTGRTAAGHGAPEGRARDAICVAVDWSGASGRSGRLALAEASGGRLRRVESFRGRDDVRVAIEAYLRSEPPVFIGIDFSFSFPAWFVGQLDVDSADALWQRVEDEGECWLRTCPWPFWGRPGRRRPADLDAPRRLRRTEAGIGRARPTDPPSPRPKSTFQIGGAGAVGTGSIRGMPHLRKLRRAGFAVWPFDEAADHTIVEIYPRALTGPVVKRDPEARAARLDATPSLLPSRLRETMIGSEDAFDAGLSALAMSIHRDRLIRLPPGDALDRIEGRIWTPDPDGPAP